MIKRARSILHDTTHSNTTRIPTTAPKQGHTIKERVRVISIRVRFVILLVCNVSPEGLITYHARKSKPRFFFFHCYFTKDKFRIRISSDIKCTPTLLSLSPPLSVSLLVSLSLHISLSQQYWLCLTTLFRVLLSANLQGFPTCTCLIT